MGGTVLVIGSAPDAPRAADFDGSKFSAIVAINNAWRVRSDWTHLVYPDDFDTSRLPDAGGGAHVRSQAYVPANNSFGGVVYAGGTMAFTAAYWALRALEPDCLAFIGCDMVYDQDGATHFYGVGEPDPLREDPTLQSLEAKANRLMALALRSGCVCINLSDRARSRLTFPRVDARDVGAVPPTPLLDDAAVDAALLAEEGAGQFVVSGDYWNAGQPVNAKELAAIDSLWLQITG